jgi:membrane protease YdiL (CAAX protease family)
VSELFLHLALATFVVVFPIWSAVTWPRFVADVRSGRPGARREAMVEVLVVQWSLVLALALGWAWSGRPWESLGLGRPGTAAWIALAGWAVLAALAVLQLRSIRASPDEARGQVLAQLGDAALFLPHDARELAWFRAVSLTAGFCEEFVYRAVLPLTLGAWMPRGWAVVAATLAFGLAHAYQGRRGVLKVTLVGATLATVAWLGGSLWPAIVLHALIDLHGGEVGHEVLRERGAGGLAPNADM